MPSDRFPEPNRNRVTGLVGSSWAEPAGGDQSGGRACVRACAQTWRVNLRGPVSEVGVSGRRVDGGQSLNSHLHVQKP